MVFGQFFGDKHVKDITIFLVDRGLQKKNHPQYPMIEPSSILTIAYYSGIEIVSIFAKMKG